jgi:hypothetical protein
MRLFFLAFCLVTTPVFGWAGGPEEDRQKAVEKAFEEAGKPGEPHQHLATFAGQWSYTAKYWPSPEAKPEESRGSASLRMIMGGRFLEQTVKGKAMGMRYEGRGTTGYDTVRRNYETVWIDNMGTGTMVAKGKYHDNLRTIISEGEYSCPISPDKAQNFRSEWKLIDRDNMVFSLFSAGLNPDGPVFKTMEMTYRRVGK